MTQKSYFWGGLATGDATLAPYTDDQFSDFIGAMIQYDRSRQGPIYSANNTLYDGALEVSWDGGTGVNIADGLALIDGKLFTNDAIVNIAITSADYWLFGLKKDHVAQTIRLFGRGGYVDRAAAIASLVQTDGVTWEIPLAVVDTTAATGLYDERSIIFPPSSLFYNTSFPRSPLVQSGYITIAASGTPDAEGTITFPVAYNNDSLGLNTIAKFPVIMLTAVLEDMSGLSYPVVAASVKDLGSPPIATVDIKVRRVDGGNISTTLQVFWIAIGDYNRGVYRS